MPRFYFDFHDGWQHHDDEEGCELPDLEAARAIAEQSVRELREQGRESGQSYSGCGFIIENEDREPLAVVPFDAERPWGH